MMEDKREEPKAKQELCYMFLTRRSLGQLDNHSMFQCRLSLLMLTSKLGSFNLTFLNTV